MQYASKSLLTATEACLVVSGLPGLTHALQQAMFQCRLMAPLQGWVLAYVCIHKVALGCGMGMVAPAQLELTSAYFGGLHWWQA